MRRVAPVLEVLVPLLLLGLWAIWSAGSDTVYYPPQLRPAAVKLAKVLHITRLRPAIAPMQFDRLTVIIATG